MIGFKMNRYIGAFLLCFILTGCTTNMINKDGRVSSCQSFGLGGIGIAVAAISHRMCTNNLKKLGYHPFDIDYGVAGIFLSDFFDPQLGSLVDSVIPGSPASCAGIQSGSYLYKVDADIVEDKEHGHKLLDNDSKESVEVVIKKITGEESVLKLRKHNVRSRLGCNI